MKLAAIYNVWDGEELLPHSINQIQKEVDLIIIVWQDRSNWGEYYNPSVITNEKNKILVWENRKKYGHVWIKWAEELNYNYVSTEFIYKKYEPESGDGALNETKKRNIGLEIAKEEGCTHFFFIDCDELYHNFREAKQQFIESGANGSVCRLFTYWGKPTYQLDPIEPYWVPFIHKLKENTVAGMQEYPFWVDPTRRVNEQNVVEIPTMMHHFSYVRKDIERKIRNSSARVNLEKSTYIQDYKDLMALDNADGYYLPGMKHKIKIVENIFNIPIYGSKQD